MCREEGYWRWREGEGRGNGGKARGLKLPFPESSRLEPGLFKNFEPLHRLFKPLHSYCNNYRWCQIGTGSVGGEGEEHFVKYIVSNHSAAHLKLMQDNIECKL